MRIKELQGAAQNLATMACSERRLGNDFEALAELPDGEVAFDLVNARATHSRAGSVSLAATQELVSWLLGVQAPALEEAQVLLQVDTNNPPTHRKTLISFRLHAVATLVVGGRSYVGQSSNHLWHNRPAQQGIQADAASPRRLT